MSDDLDLDPSELQLPPGMLYRMAWGLYLVMAIAGLLWIGAHFDALPLELFVAWDSLPIDLGIGLGSGLGLAGSWHLARGRLPGMRRMEAQMLELFGGLDLSELIALSIISGFAEEIFFRGAMQASWGWPWALAFFTLSYTSGRRAFVYWTAFALVQGAVLGALMLLRGNLTAPIVAHMVTSAITLRGLVQPTVAVE